MPVATHSPRADPLPIERSGPVDATVRLPGSKSITNRALACAALADGPSVLTGWLDAGDTRAMIEALQALGVGIVVAEDLEVGGGGPNDRVVSVHARQSGTTARFLLPLLALDDTVRRLDGDRQLQVRPMGETFEALRQLGARIDDEGVPGHLPVVVQGPVRNNEVELAGHVSSQFLSGLLLAGPAVPGGLRVQVTTELVSRPYVEMTLGVMAAFGAQATRHGATWQVDPGRYAGRRYHVEPDASAASYAWAAAVVTGGSVTVPGLSSGALQGDVEFATVLERMGATVDRRPDAITVSAGAELRGIDIDMRDISDTVPTLAAVAAVADGPTTVRGVGFIRRKETDRIAATVTELRRCGVEAHETDDGFVVVPGPIEAATVATYDDHRMAMSFALLGLVSDGIRIADPACVDKTFPGYWDLLDGLRAGTWPAARAV